MAQNLELYFEGNDKLTHRELYEALELHQPYFYEFYLEHPKVERKTLDLLVLTLKNYYKTKGYFHAKLELVEEKDRALIRIEEKEVLRIKNLTINAEYDLRDLLEIQEGSVFESSAFTQSKKELENFYAEKGFCNAAIDAKAWIDTEKNFAYLLYDLKKNSLCYFGAIEVEGSKNIDANIVRSLLVIQEGDVFSRERIAKSYKNIYKYDGISDTLIDTHKDTNNSLVNIMVRIEENQKPLRFEAGLGYSSDEGAMGLLALKHRNFFGNLQSLGLSLRVTEIKQTIKLDYEQILLDKNFRGFELGFEDETFIGFKEQRVFGGYYFKQERGLHSFKESLLFDDAKVYRSDPLYLFANTSSFILSPKLEYNYDTRDKLLDPTQGYYLNAELMGSKKSAFSDASYVKYNLSAAYLYPLDSHVFGFKTSYGSLKLYEGILPPSYRFFAGGMHSNRAYSYRDLGEKNIQGDPRGSMSLFESTLEWRFALYGPFRGVLFSDTSFLGEGASPNYDKAYVSAGFGLRYKTPIGPLAIDFGFDTQDPLKHYAIHFHIGELF